MGLSTGTCSFPRFHWQDRNVHKLLNRINRWKIWTDSLGQDLVEYALAAGMIALTAVAAMPALCTAVNNVFSKIGSTILSTVQ